MRIKSIVSGITLMFLASGAYADLTPWQDYELGDAVWSVTTVMGDPNMGGANLEGITQTWAASNAVAKELGQIEDYWIYRSDLPQSGHCNLVLVIKFASTADLAPNKTVQHIHRSLGAGECRRLNGLCTEKLSGHKENHR